MKNQKFTLQELINSPSFIRWTTGQADAKEAGKWNRWVERNESNRRLAIHAQHLITGVSFQASLSVDRKEDWRQIEQQIFIRPKPRRFSPSQHRSTNYSAVFLRIAALFLLVAVSGGIALYMQGNSNPDEIKPVSVHSISTDFSEKKTISLSDGSEIILAAGSRLSYKEDWLKQPTWRVALLEGEAYFSIKPDDGSNRTAPRFEVQTEDGTTSVMGTRFSVSTYGAGTQVVLEEGEVRLTTAKSDEDHPDAVTLAPGEMAQWSKQQAGISLSEVNPKVYTSWVSDHLFFDDTPLSHLVRRIERTYGVHVEVKDAALLNMKLSGAVDFHSLDALIHAVSKVLDIRIRQAGDRIFIEKANSS